MTTVVVHCHDKFEWFEKAWALCPGCGVTYARWLADATKAQAKDALAALAEPNTWRVSPRRTNSGSVVGWNVERLVALDPAEGWDGFQFVCSHDIQHNALTCAHERLQGNYSGLSDAAQALRRKDGAQ
ncbi:hypothetical protein [Gordonia malaquae]|uniref:hypothetical protein n=1 Tax=Gordonia malaquae TaxID=410332 RepID=UPI0030FE1AE2